MIKILFVGVWASLVTLGANYAAARWVLSRANRPIAQVVSASETRKTKEINVPVVRDGAVKGYVVAQFSYVVDLAVAQKLPAQPDAFIVDEAFRYIYDDEGIDFSHLERLDLDKLTHAVITRTNERMKAEVVTEMGVQECNFLLNAEARGKL